MTVREVSAYLRVHPITIYRLLKRNQIPAFHIGSDWRHRPLALAAGVDSTLTTGVRPIRARHGGQNEKRGGPDSGRCAH